MPTQPDTERAFQKLVKTLTSSDPDVEAPQATRREFGSNALKVNGKIFAMLVRGSLVLKLPKARVEALIASGQGGPFDAGKGKPMKEWVTVLASERTWLALAHEARAFVGPQKGR
jgi:TfoX/Sxy family transcriptional regulator of competence genes